VVRAINTAVTVWKTKLPAGPTAPVQHPAKEYKIFAIYVYLCLFCYTIGGNMQVRATM
jgi:hypothetical protein